MLSEMLSEMSSADTPFAHQFLPNIGRLVVDAMEEKLEPSVASRFAPHRKANVHPPSRVGPPPRPLNLGELCEASDLKNTAE